MSFHGLLLIDKPKGMTSHDVVARVRKALRCREVGHAGTLDPAASGLLVLLVGEGTKISDYVLSGDKGYRVRVRFGLATDTFDMEGEILERQEVNLAPETIDAAAAALTGEFEWEVPVYSAVKVKGQKLYEMARKGQDVQPPRKKMTFWGYRRLAVGPDDIEAEIQCSKGSYIRTWAVELGRALGVPAVMEDLKRIYSHPFHLSQAIPLAELEERMGRGESLQGGKGTVSLRDALPHFLTVTVRDRDEKLMRAGQVSFDLERRLIYEQKQVNKSRQALGVKVLGGQGQMLSILEVQPFQRIKIKRVFKGLDASV